MQQVYIYFQQHLQQLWRKTVLLGCFSLLVWAGSIFTVAQPGYTAVNNQSTAQEEIITPVVGEVSSREEAYEKAVEVAQDPEGLDKEYEKELQEYEAEHAGKGNLVEAAKQVVDKVTGKD